MALEKELETYKTLLPSLTADQGKYVLIEDSKMIGVYESYQDALSVGYDKFGVKPFLVKKILATEEIQFFTRNIFEPCHL